MTARSVRNGLGAALLAAGLLVPTGIAHAAGCVGAPGTSALEQYCEAVPDADGSRSNPGASSSNHGSTSSSSGSSAPSATVRKLERSGSDGKAVAALAGAAVIKGSGGGDGDGGSGSGSAGSGSSSASGGTGSSTSSGATGGAGGSGGSSTAAVVAPAAPSGSALHAAREAVETGPTAGSGVAWGIVAMSIFGGLGALLLHRRSLRAPIDGPAEAAAAE